MDTTQILISEFIGTAVLMAFGSGTNASVLLKNTLAKAFNPNWMTIMFGWAFGVAFAVYIGIALGGPAHLNPALTIALAAGGMFPWDHVLPVSLAQIAGAFMGSALVMLHYYPHFKQTKEDEGNVVGIFATAPTSDNRVLNVISEIIATFMFMLAILCLGKMGDGLFPFIVGVLVASIGLSFGSTTGFALNPARDFGPRLAYTILPVPNRGATNWAYAWVPIIGPIIGASAAVGLFLAIAPK
ncbi:MIP/aquaporin family protein [Veillonella intestinalis]|uniref:MIP/aquaporin family protein n=1 Tax=Veillonella intestinalis TaxID=2941341 RepID=UPI00203DA791|nr:MIP/aquaporin family protein [Veillonella intestinalis]